VNNDSSKRSSQEDEGLCEEREGRLEKESEKEERVKRGEAVGEPISNRLLGGGGGSESAFTADTRGVVCYAGQPVGGEQETMKSHSLSQ